MKLRSAALLAAVLAPALTVNVAHAASEASASASIVKIELIDLDQNDGITPSLQFIPHTPPTARPNGVIHTQTMSGADAGRQFATQWQAWQPFAIEKTVGDALHATATLGGTSLATLSTSATVKTGATADIFDASADVQAPFDFFLSPNSSVSITFDLSARSVAGDSRWAISRAGAAMVDDVGPWTVIGPHFELEHYNYGSGLPDIGQAAQQQFTGTLTSGAEGNYFTVVLNTRATVSPVPEPSTWGMLLAGLGLVGAAGRRARGERAA